jgi:mRNA-degrading endonuclease RelE of RelBE toxin-antitoxin system
MYNSISKEMQKSIQSLDKTDQNKVLNYVRSLLKNKKGSDFPTYFGSLTKEDAKSIKNAVEEGCKKIDHNEW